MIIELACKRESVNEELQSILEMHSLCVLYFTAPWCSSCKILNPILQKVFDGPSYKESITLVKINVEKYPEIAEDENISSLPVFIMIKDENQRDRLDFALTSFELKKWIEDYLP